MRNRAHLALVPPHKDGPGEPSEKTALRAPTPQQGASPDPVIQAVDDILTRIENVFVCGVDDIDESGGVKDG